MFESFRAWVVVFLHFFWRIFDLSGRMIPLLEFSVIFNFYVIFAYDWFFRNHSLSRIFYTFLNWMRCLRYASRVASSCWVILCCLRPWSTPVLCPCFLLLYFFLGLFHSLGYMFSILMTPLPPDFQPKNEQNPGPFLKNLGKLPKKNVCYRYIFFGK